MPHGPLSPSTARAGAFAGRDLHAGRVAAIREVLFGLIEPLAAAPKSR